MNHTLQWIGVGIILAIAIWRLAVSLVRSTRRENDSDCGCGCSGCKFKDDCESSRLPKND